MIRYSVWLMLVTLHFATTYGDIFAHLVCFLTYFLGDWVDTPFNKMMSVDYEMRSFDSARKACWEKGGTLVSIRSNRESNYVLTNIHRGKDAWLGLSSDSFDRMIWMSDGHLFEHDSSNNHWGANDVKCKNSRATAEPCCVFMNSFYGAWVTTNCTTKTAITICEARK